jgi:hypothetical protein
MVRPVATATRLRQRLQQIYRECADFGERNTTVSELLNLVDATTQQDADRPAWVVPQLLKSCPCPMITVAMA